MSLPGRHNPPQALHLVRLAQGSPDKWIILPGGLLRVLALSHKISETLSGWLTCLAGEAVLDLPQREFVRLGTCETYHLAAESWEALPVKTGTVLLFVPDD